MPTQPPCPSQDLLSRPWQLGQQLGPGRWWRWLVSAVVAVLVFWPTPAWAAPGQSDGAQLFQAQCVGCHVGGGNVMRRSKTLKLAALQRNDITSAQAVALIAENGVGRMGGYGSVLGEGGPAAVGAYVWDQAQAGWPKV